MVLELRPHHIEFLGLRMRLSSNRLRDQTTLIRKAYGSEMLDKINGMVMQILRDRSTRVRVVEGTDDICRGCAFMHYCSAGQYDFVRRMFADKGWPLSGSRNPDESDANYAEKKGLVVGKDYSVGELFG